MTKQNVLRSYLNWEFLRRKERNDNYSLRAFAMSMEIDPTFLSRLMKGERAFTKKTVNRICTHLKTSLDEIETFVENLQLNDMGVYKLSDIEFSPVSKWYFFAILDLFSLKNFQSNINWIAESLGLSLSETSDALDVLEQNEMISRSESPWTVNKKSTNWVNVRTTSAIRKDYQKQVTEKAKEALDKVDYTNRESVSLTVAASKSLVPEIKERIKKFMNELRVLTKEHQSFDEVYQLQIAYFPLSQIRNKEVNNE